MLYGALSHFNELSRRPNVLLREVANSDRPCESSQMHHLIPNDVWNTLLSKNEFSDLPLEALAGGRHNQRNLMELPSTRAGALASGRALHNGSHPAYSGYVLGMTEKLAASYKAERVASPESAAANFAKSIGDLEDTLRMGLDRRYAATQSQLLLTSKDPYAPYVGTDQLLVTEAAEGITARLQTAVDMARADPRSAYPNAALADKNCEAAKELTVEQLQQVTSGLREKGINVEAFADSRIPARVPATTFMDALKQEAEDHPYIAGAAALGVGALAVVGGARALALSAAGAQAIRLAPTAAAAALFAGPEAQQTPPPPEHQARPVNRAPALNASP